MFYQFYIVIAIFLLLWLIIWWKYYNKTVLIKKCNLPYRPTPNLLIAFIRTLLYRNSAINPGNWMFRYLQAQDRIYDKERLHSTCVAGNIMVHLYKPEHIEVILNSHVVLDKGWIYNNLRFWLGNGLITRPKEIWKPRRKLLTPAFHFKILENFQAVINKHSFILIDQLRRKSQEPWINVISVMSLCTLDIIAETAMGIEIKAQGNKDSQYVKAIKRIEDLILIKNMYPWFWSDIIFKLTPSGREFHRVVNTLHNFTKKVILEKKREMQQDMDEIKNSNQEDSENVYMQSKKRRAFLSLLLHNHLNVGNISEEDIKEEVNTFMFAGHDTTSVGTSWALYNIGLYPDIQKKVYNEIYSIFGEDKERQVTSDDLQKLKYLDCVLKETHRLFPSVPLIGRDVKEDFQLSEKIWIPAKSFVLIQIYSLHHDPEYYSNPEIFDPERFLPENSVGRHPFAYIPFSAGPRNCIGQKYAMMEEKIIITNILRHFTVKSLDHPDKLVLCAEIVLRPVKELRLQFKAR